MKTFSRAFSRALALLLAVATVAIMLPALAIGAAESGPLPEARDTGADSHTEPCPIAEPGQTGVLSLGGATAPAGGTAAVTVNLDKNPGINSITIDIAYSEGLELVDIDYQNERGLPLFGASAYVYWLTEMPIHSPDAFKKNPKRLSWDAILAPANIMTTGVIATLYFKVPQDALPGTQYTVTPQLGDYFIDFDLNIVEFELYPATVTVADASLSTFVPGKSPTCTEPGNKPYYADADGNLFSDPEGKVATTLEEVTIPPTGHALTHREALEPTQTEPGNIEYWLCTVCGKLFLDKEATQETTLEEVTIPMDDGSPKIVVSSGEAKRGETVTLTLSLQNNPGIISLLLDLHYDGDALELVDIDYQNEAGLPLFGESRDVNWYTEMPSDNPDAFRKNPKRLSWAADTEGGNVTTNGAIAYLTFLVKGSTPLDSASVYVTYDPDNDFIYNFDLEPVEFGAISGTVTIYGEPVATLVPKKAPTCTEPGNIEYYEGYDGKLYLDEAATQEVSPEDVIIPATGHSLTKTDAKAWTCELPGNIEYYTCSVCGKVFRDAAATTEITVDDTVIPPTGHALVYFPAKEATTTENGNLEYYQCSVCGKLFLDAAGARPTTAEEVTIPALNPGQGATPGDVDGKPGITVSDRTYLARALAGWEGYTLDPTLADVNRDGEVNVADRTYLARALAGWEGYVIA